MWRIERGDEPVHLASFEGDDIEAARGQAPGEESLGQPGREPGGGMGQSALLVSIDAGGCSAVAQIAPGAHLDEHQHVARLHDEIDFSSGAAQVASQQAQPGRLQVGQGGILEMLPQALRGGSGGFAWRVESRSLPKPREPAAARTALRLAGDFVEGEQAAVGHGAGGAMEHGLHWHDSSSRSSSMNQVVPPDLPADAWRRVAERVDNQHWPESTLYVVATPIGNLGDMGLRAWQALARADVIAAEDTRESRNLLDAWGVSTPLMAAHRHNEAQAAEAICARLAQGQRVALVSDAGAPAVSDPGARIVRAVRAAGHRVLPIPGPSAVIAALMASGVTTDENPSFAFAGFAPPKTTARVRWCRQWTALPTPIVMFESPHRLAALMHDLLEVCGATRQVTLARELTKRFEDVVTMALGDVAAWLEGDDHRSQGEFVVIVHAPPEVPADQADAAQADTLLEALLETVSVRDAARVAARVTGLPKDALYSRALALKQ